MARDAISNPHPTLPKQHPHLFNKQPTKKIWDRETLDKTDAEAEAQEAEEAGDVAKGNVSAQLTMMTIASLQMMNIWPPFQTQIPPRI